VLASEDMKGDRELCMAAVAQDWRALQYASEELKGDRELCMAAVAQNGRALEFASQEMKGDRELCMAAVADHGNHLDHNPEFNGVLRFVSDGLLKKDEATVIAAIQSHLRKYPNDKGNLSELEKFTLRDVPKEMLQNSRVRNAGGI